MKNLMSRWLKNSLVVFCCLISTLESSPVEDYKKDQMVATLEMIKHVLEVEYAPQEWKRSYAGWDLNTVLANSCHQISSSNKMTTKQFQQVVKDFLGTTKDYHVNVLFLSTEAATLPFSVRSADGHYFVDWIDTKRLSPAVYNLEVGDELVLFGGRPVDEVVQELREKAGRFANKQTDQSLATINLTFRSGQRGDVIPKGPINVGFKSVTNEQFYSYQFMWNYQPEHIFNPKDVPLKTARLVPFADDKKSLDHTQKSFFSLLGQLYKQPMKEAHGIGSYKSFLPEFGRVVWKAQDSPFYAYLYQNDQGNLIGYVRIPHYRIWGSEIERFGEIIKVFQEKADAMVIDQLDNPGGFVQNQYFLASMLTEYPLETPKHRLMINQQDVWEAFEILRVLEEVESDEDAENLFFGAGLFKSYQYALFLKDYYHFIIQEWYAGRTLTDPIHIEGVDHINPHPKYRYTKPILILINELDFSGGDFFPAIMQDNKRATLFGTRTAGAGGYVRVFSFPNNYGIAGFSYTASIAERVDKSPIEDLGVTPDIEYNLTQEDLQYHYQSYTTQVNQVLNDIIKE